MHASQPIAVVPAFEIIQHPNLYVNRHRHTHIYIQKHINIYIHVNREVIKCIYIYVLHINAPLLIHQGMIKALFWGEAALCN